MNIIMVTRSINIMERIISKLIAHTFISCLMSRLKQLCKISCINLYFLVFIVDIATQRITTKVVGIFALRIFFMDDRKDLLIRMANGR